MKNFKLLILFIGLLVNYKTYSQNIQNELLNNEVKRIYLDGYEYVERDLNQVLNYVSTKIDKKIHSDSSEYYWNYYFNMPHPSVATLKMFFKDAAEEFNVPQYLLEIIAYTENNWTQIGPSIDRGWGIMHLVENNYCNTLNDAAILLNIEKSVLKNNAQQNIRGAAALLSFYAGENSKEFTKLEEWFDAAKKFTGLINNELQIKQVKTYYDNLKSGIYSKTLWGEEFIIEPYNNIDISDELLKYNVYKNNKTTDYASAISGFITCNFTSGRSHAIDTWVHHWIGTGTYAGALSWFNNCSAQASAHFVIRSSDGEITQCVEVKNTAWHCGASGYPNNSRSIGVEHEATAANPSLWNSTSMLQASANMTCYFTNTYPIPSTLHSSPGICGHNEMPGTNTACPGSLPWSLWENYYNSCMGISQSPQNLTTNYQNCSNNNVTFSWDNSGNGWFIAVSTDPNFNQYYWKWVSNLTSYTGPSGFVDRIDGVNPLIFYNGLTYYWKMWNGNSFSNTLSFSIPKCDNILPQANINNISEWQTQNFNITFNDVDNTSGSGIAEMFYLITDFDGSYWSANFNEGFFYENFDNNFAQYWLTYANAGNWIIQNSYIEQSDINIANSFLSAPLKQNNSNSFLYHFNTNISSSGSSKTSGFYFFASNPSAENRGDSYYVSLNAEDNNIKILKSVNNVLALKQICPFNFNTNVWYDIKIIYNPSKGNILVFINNNFTTAWTDTTPLSIGDYISFKTENTISRFDMFKVYKNRNSSEIIKVGSSQQNHIRYQSLNSNYSANIFALNIDKEQNISNTDLFKIKTDWTIPAVVNVNDGQTYDIDTIYNNQLIANWNNSHDNNSGIEKYNVCIGSAPENCNIVNWFDNGILNSVVIDNINLINGHKYYVNVKATNNAGLYSISSSDGVLFLETTSTINVQNNDCKNIIFPNPTSDYVYLKLCENEELITIKIFNTLGTYIILNTQIIKTSNNILKINLNTSGIKSGVYFIEYTTNKNVITRKLGRVKNFV